MPQRVDVSGGIGRRAFLGGLAASAIAAGTVAEMAEAAGKETPRFVTGVIESIDPAAGGLVLGVTAGSDDKPRLSGQKLRVVLAPDAFLVRDHEATLDEFAARDWVAVEGSATRKGVFSATGMTPVLRNVDTTITGIQGNTWSTGAGTLLITTDTRCDTASAKAKPNEFQVGDSIHVLVRDDPRSSVGVVNKVSLATHDPAAATGRQ